MKCSNKVHFGGHPSPHPLPPLLPQSCPSRPLDFLLFSYVSFCLFSILLRHLVLPYYGLLSQLLVFYIYMYIYLCVHVYAP